MFIIKPTQGAICNLLASVCMSRSNDPANRALFFFVPESRKSKSIEITSENTLGDTSSSTGFRPIGELPWFHVGAEHLSDSQWCF